MLVHWKKISLSPTAPISEAMENLNKFGLRIVLIADENDSLIATVTDGDIRRGLLQGFNLADSVSKVMNTEPVVISPGLTKNEISTQFHSFDVLAIPVLGENRKIVGLELINERDKQREKDTAVVLMAGGFGKRLMPLTEDTPKPMLPVGSKPILEHIIENLISQGFVSFYIMTHYKSDIIKEHFQKKKYPGITIEIIFEDDPLGTAGALFFLKDKINSDFIVMNSDLLIKTDFKEIIYFHKKHNNLGTLCTKQYDYQVPFGIVCTDGDSLSGILEKPTYTHFINAGIYCYTPSVFNYINEKKYLDMPNLLEKVMNDNKKIDVFLIHEYWSDIGSIKDYNEAQSNY